MEAEISREE